MKFLVYGEDGLSLKYLRENLSELLNKLDKSNPEDCTVFYRPSFGRTRHYGEFDAIIITPKNAYLIESKWDGSSDISLGLKENQIKRHKILKWYQDNWKGETGEDWNKFADNNNPEFKREFPGKYIPHTHDKSGRPTKLATNLQYILKSIGNNKMHNILLVFYENEKLKVEQEDFIVIEVPYKTTNGLYIEMK